MEPFVDLLDALWIGKINGFDARIILRGNIIGERFFNRIFMVDRKKIEDVAIGIVIVRQSSMVFPVERICIGYRANEPLYFLKCFARCSIVMRK